MKGTANMQDFFLLGRYIGRAFFVYRIMHQWFSFKYTFTREVPYKKL